MNMTEPRPASRNALATIATIISSMVNARAWRRLRLMIFMATSFARSTSRHLSGAAARVTAGDGYVAGRAVKGNGARMCLGYNENSSAARGCAVTIERDRSEIRKIGGRAIDRVWRFREVHRVNGAGPIQIL